MDVDEIEIEMANLAIFIPTSWIRSWGGPQTHEL